MSLKKAWVYDSQIPQPLAEELSANGYDGKRCPSSDFKAKYEEMEEYSISATGDMDMELVWNWPRLSVAAFATELKLRRKKYRSKGNRSVSFGSNSYYQESNEADRSRRRYLKLRRSLGIASYPYNTNHIRVVSEPVTLDTVDDLLSHLKDYPVLEPSPAQPTIPLPSITGNDTNADLSFGSDFTESDISDTSRLFDVSLTSQGEDDADNDDFSKAKIGSTTVHKEKEQEKQEVDKDNEYETEELLTILSRSCPGDVNKNTRSTNRARTASLRAFAAYHLEKKKTNDDTTDLDLESSSPFSAIEANLLGDGDEGSHHQNGCQLDGSLSSSRLLRPKKAPKSVPAWA